MDFDASQARRLMDALLGEEAEAGPVGEGSAQLSPGPFGRYRLLRLIGSGGMGEVYEAEQDHPRRKVALKVIRADVLSPEAAARFEHEAKILGRLQHPGIARIYEAGRVAAQGVMMPYFAMEFVDGRPLLDYLHQNQLGLRARLDLFVRICEAVEHAHRMGVIHRDLKPANILTDASGQPRVLDFGVARVTDPDAQATLFKTDVGRLVGTLAFMSPEQVSQDSEGLDTRSDVYALGVVLYEMLSGRPPYRIEAGKVYEAARIIRETEPEPLGSEDRALRGDVQTIVSKALAKERDRRYQSVGELAADIRRYLRSEPIEARPPSVVYQIRKLAGRHRLAAGAAAIVVLVTLAATGAVGLFAVRQTRALDLAAAAAAAEAVALRQAEAGRMEAEKERAVAQGVLEFMLEVFSQARDTESGRAVTVVEALETASQGVDAKFPDAPETAAAVKGGIGRTLHALGRWEQAEQNFRSGLELARGKVPEQSEAYIQLLGGLSSLLKEQKRYADAEPLARAWVAAEAARRGPGDSDTLAASGVLAAVLAGVGRHDEARATFQDAIDRCLLGPGEQTPLCSQLMHNYAVMLLNLKERQEAETYFLRALSIRQQIYGPEDSRTMTTLGGLAVIYTDTGQFEKAVPLLNRVVESRRQQLGEQHPRTLQAMYNLARAKQQMGLSAEATDLYQQVTQAKEAGGGPPDSVYISSLRQLSRLLSESGDVEGTRRRVEQALDAMRSRRGALQDSPDDVCIDLAESLARVRLFAEAELALATPDADAQAGSGQPRLSDARLRSLVKLCEDWGDPGRAAKYRALLEASSPAEPR